MTYIHVHSPPPISLKIVVLWLSASRSVMGGWMDVVVGWRNQGGEARYLEPISVALEIIERRLRPPR